MLRSPFLFPDWLALTRIGGRATERARPYRLEIILVPPV